MNTIYDTIATLKSAHKLSQHPYFMALERGEFERERFIQTQVQFLHAVALFPRAVALLATRMTRPEHRAPLLANVYEEHGEGDLEQGHERTFLKLLSRLGCDEQALSAQAMWPQMRAFNAMFMGICAHDHVLTGVAMVGMFEDLFSGISTKMGQGMCAAGWLEPEQLIHYSVHEALDIEHARELYQVAAPFYHEPGARYAIEQGLSLGCWALLNLFEQLFIASGQADATRRPAQAKEEVMGWSAGVDY